MRQLMELARSEVRKQFGVELVAEVKLLGDWSANRTIESMVHRCS